MDAERCLQQVVDALRYVNVQPWIGQCEHDLLRQVLVIPGHCPFLLQEAQLGADCLPHLFRGQLPLGQCRFQLALCPLVRDQRQQLGDTVFGGEEILVHQHDLLEERLYDRVRPLDAVVHLVPERRSGDAVLAHSPSTDQMQVLGDGTPILAVQMPRRLVADPAMDSTTTTENPQQVLESKVLAQCSIDHLAGDGHKLPAFSADFRLLTTRPNLVVVRHVDIEHQLSLHRLYVADGAVLLRPNGHHGSNVDLVGVPGANLFLELLRRLEGQVAQVNVIGQREGELSVAEYGGFGWKAVVELKGFGRRGKFKWDSHNPYDNQR